MQNIIDCGDVRKHAKMLQQRNVELFAKNGKLLFDADKGNGALETG